MNGSKQSRSSDIRIAIVGGGAAGVFAAIAAAESSPSASVTVLEKGPSFLSKVRISGGGRCNVTHACFDPREFCTRYPRGSRELLGPFHQFQASDTVEWFEARGTRLKTEADGRIFPVTDDSQTIVDCLLESCKDFGVELVAKADVQRIDAGANAFTIGLKGGRKTVCDRLLVACGGLRSEAMQQSLSLLGHSIQPPVPSLFTFHIELPWLRSLAGITLPNAQVSIAGGKSTQSGPLLVTHQGLSGPAILKLSAWEARRLRALDYRAELIVDWLPGLNEEALREEIASIRISQAAKRIANAPIAPVPARLWEALVRASGVSPSMRCSEISRPEADRLAKRLKRSTLPVSGKSMNKEEFVTCGGVTLKEVDFRTMESRITPGLFFAGETLDIDGITGGFNFQAAWTTGWIAGRNMAVS